LKPDFDIAVIGAGSGGLTVAAAAAQFGQRVVLFEKGEMGGDCLNYGCVPSKALLAAAKHAHAIRSAAAYGIASQEPGVDFPRVMAHVRRAIAAIAPHDSQERFEKLGVTVIRALARFEDQTTVGAGGQSYSARRIVVATGSRPAIPPIPGLDHVFHFTNESIFASDVLPRHLIIIGGGPIGMEMAQAHRRLGSEVTVIEAALPLARDDPELAAVALGALKREGIRILAETKVKSVSRSGGGIVVETDLHGEISGSHLLVAAGRKPNVETLNLAAAGIAFTAKGITVDTGLRTTNKKVYAIGDVAGGPQFTHAAGYHAGLVIRNALFGMPVKTDAAVPWVTYTDPELAHVGLTEAEARMRHGDAIRVLRWPFENNDRAQAEGSSEGLVKIVTSRSGRILGASIAGAGAGELIHPWVLALSRRLKIGAMATPVLPYPTRGEAGKRAAVSYFSDIAASSWARRIIGVVKTLIA
jgi:pyruvate/2-oxoglutarate dehydrogenase complex dihydrolipoamide dehydrogenase (E3) component